MADPGSPRKCSPGTDNRAGSLAGQPVRLEERVQTMQAACKTGIARRAADATKHDTDNLCPAMGLWIAAIMLAGIPARRPNTGLDVP